MRLGNGKFENTTFNSRLQPIQIGLGSSATSQNLLKLNFDYGLADNNGNVKSQTITTPTIGTATGFTALQTYSYDSLNRLKDAKEMIGTAQQWKQTFTFDRYGNRTFDTTNNNTTTLANGCPVAICNPTANPNDNKLVGTNYDSVGNTSQDANGQTFVYDAENKQTKVVNAQGVTIGEYFYDGDGKRIKKVVSSTNETTIFVYDASGKMVAEYSTITASQTEAKVSYLTNDHLGSPRITTDSFGKVVSRRDFMPFGEEIQRANYGSDLIREKFATYERDTETELDFAQARYYSKNLGRFNSVDPLLSSAKRVYPQSWNRYGYCLNNPVNITDPLGLIWVRNNSSGIPSWVDDDKYDKNSKDYTVIPASGLEFTRDGKQVVLDIAGPSGDYAGWMFDGQRIGWDGNALPVTPSMSAGSDENSGVGSLLFDFITGTGQTERQFGPRSSMTTGMRTSPEVTVQRRNFCSQGACRQFTRYRGGRRFGLLGGGADMPSEDGAVRAAVEDGIFTPRSFVGSFGIEISGSSSESEDTLFVIENETTRTSLFYHLPIPNSRTGIMRTTKQMYWWLERNPCNCK